MLDFGGKLLGAVALLAVPSVADAQRRAPSSLIDAVVACEAIADTAERVGCYDRTVRALKEAREEKREAFTDREVRRPAREEFQPITSTVKSVTDLAGGRALMVLADSSVWTTTEGSRLSPRAGAPILITKGAFGSFLADIGELRGVRVRQLR